MTKNTTYTFEKPPVSENWSPQFPYMPWINANPIDSKFLK